MEFRKLTSILLATVIVLCPFRCAIGACQQQVGEEVQPAVCNCCHPTSAGETNRGDSSSPASPDGDSPCCDCVCQGALTQHDQVDGKLLPITDKLSAWFAIQPKVLEVRSQVAGHSFLISASYSAADVRARLAIWTL